MLQRGLETGVATQVAGRAFFAALALLVVVTSQACVDGQSWWHLQRSELAMAGCMGVASGVFMVALNYASVANVLIVQAAAPLVAAAISWWKLGETVTGRTATAMLLALAGVGIIAGGPGGIGAIGLLLSVLICLAFAGAIVIARHRRDISMMPAMCLSQVAVLVVAAPFAQPGTVNANDLWRLAVLGVVQVGLGLGLLTVGARYVPAAEVALISLLEVVLGPVWVWLFLSERPGVATLVGGVVVILAAGLLVAGRGPGPVISPGRSQGSVARGRRWY